jgi:hypothetical protein
MSTPTASCDIEARRLLDNAAVASARDDFPESLRNRDRRRAIRAVVAWRRSEVVAKPQRARLEVR